MNESYTERISVSQNKTFFVFVINRKMPISYLRAEALHEGEFSTDLLPPESEVQ